MIAKPIRRVDESLVDFAYRMHQYFDAVTKAAITDIRQIDRIRAPKMVSKAIATRETERERISVHEKAQNNPLLRELLRKMQI